MLQFLKDYVKYNANSSLHNNLNDNVNNNVNNNLNENVNKNDDVNKLVNDDASMMIQYVVEVVLAGSLYKQNPKIIFKKTMNKKKNEMIKNTELGATN